MAVKTMALDIEAYEALVRHKKPGQSFSQVIKLHFGRRCTGRDLLDVIDRMTLSEPTLDAIDAVIDERRQDLGRLDKGLDRGQL